MNRVVTVEEMKAIDRTSIAGNPDTGYIYMKRAAEGIVSKVIEKADTKEITIICGKGNNGGDGYAAASILIRKGYNPVCYSPFSGEDFSGEAKLAYNEYIKEGGIPVQISSPEEIRLESDSFVVDAMLGTGIKGGARGIFSKIITRTNDSEARILSVDTPSGYSDDSGNLSGNTVRADYTVTMGFAKRGQLFYPGREYIGELCIKDLGYPEDIVRKNSSRYFILSEERISGMLPVRNPEGSKTDHGILFSLSGSRGMTGAGILSGKAALITGCGMVHTLSTKEAAEKMSSGCIECVYHTGPETDSGSLDSGALQNALKIAGKSKASLIGPGVSRNVNTQRLIKKLISEISTPMIIDADGINAVSEDIGILKGLKPETVLTPHNGEWKRLFGSVPEKGKSIEAVAEKAFETGCYILLKGNPSILGTPEREALILPYGNSGLATAGSGDVLSGIIGSLMAQGAGAEDAAVCGAYIHGKTGDEAAESLSEYSVTASELIRFIPGVIKGLSKKRYGSMKIDILK